ncbi:hypothetical protein L208DRAFT_1421300 [Tricholoma matsutake]|nr:hypothetical protein L208DRAFT_1421300 [Tricholoma matsutake 945]
MEPFVDNPPLWDLSHASSFSQLADDDFLALLQKQFPTEGASNLSYPDAVNPQSISRYSLASMTPPSEDSSPSPDPANDDGADPALKRKASDDSMEGGPSQKTQHTANSKKSITVPRRKSTGTSGPPKDETRLLKRKEQNRAAQRAFRERKEKHVKDLEDKVAALEAKNEQAISENENLRDLLSRLQNENLSLKQSSFTFSVPKSASGNSPEKAQASTSFASQSPVFPSTSRPLASSPVASSPRTSPNLANPLEWSSLTTFDPAVLNLLDDSPQQTATDGAMQMDFGFGSNTGLSAHTPYTTIASNPMFISFASTFDTESSPSSNTDSNSFSNFDLSGLTSWPTPNSAHDGSLDDLLAGYMQRGPVDYPFLPPSSTASESPVAHHANHTSSIAASHSPSFSSTSSPSSSVSDPLFDTHRDSSSSESDIGHEIHNEKECPKTKGEFAKRIEDEGPSPFAPKIRKSTDAMLGSMIMCEGTMFPKTQLSDKNVEVLKAWRSITSNPQFKDIDVNELCTEFTNKARCDGTKVVLEPQGVDHIIKSLSSMKK